jgi:hypothetical protein
MKTVTGIIISLCLGLLIIPAVQAVDGQEAILDSVEEVTFNEEQMKTYLACYTDPCVMHVRKALNGYLAGTNEGMLIPKATIEGIDTPDLKAGLARYDRSYYKSKFTVLALNDAITGGVNVRLIFQDKPDKVFVAWVYKTGDGIYDLRGFWEDMDLTQNIEIIKKIYRKYVFDKINNM